MWFLRIWNSNSEWLFQCKWSMKASVLLFFWVFSYSIIKFHQWFLVLNCPFYNFKNTHFAVRAEINQIIHNVLQIVLKDGWEPLSSACCDSRAAVCTNTWLSFVGMYNWGWRGVDTSSCLQGWNKDLTPAAVQHRHQLGLGPAKMSFTPSVNTAVLSPSQPHASFTFFYSPWLFLSRHLLYSFSPHPHFTLLNIPLPLQPKFLSHSLLLLVFALSPPTCKSFPVTQHWFSANFSSLLEHQSLWHSSSWLLWWLHMPLLAWVVVNWGGEWGPLKVTSAVFYK